MTVSEHSGLVADTSGTVSARPSRALPLAALALAGSAAVCLAMSSIAANPHQVELAEHFIDRGEDYVSAVEAPHKIYEFPWLQDGHMWQEAMHDAYGPESKWGRGTGSVAYHRNYFDEFGDRGYDVDMRPADDCYNEDHEDCYAEDFDTSTGYIKAA
mmetsp:Transcript_48673/g.75996  ORF Transcript_48673/g.75996 Transcript_48673/m.75996 type:complete len:157 (-) Transcript_48673:198-668(-)|eukprot:CAMPEP_0184291162 /NCGR_PEP_ID=MMETSP1049-20130417/3239_1 /TAXON_ID=77928 /ORGANISM="Proteomonas sulcata, Strain CCMP704" /LENGTH=156 /DNA_ID=CAMNT_0026598509 /DNA_START=108 /DNA_END=578 /DNA_ORIENTATION=-